MVGKRVAAIALAALLATTGRAATPAGNVPSAEDFGALPFLTAPVIAPDGLHLVARTQVDGRPRLLIVDVSNDKGATSAIAVPEGSDIQWYRWAGNGTLLIGVGRAITFMGQSIRSSGMLAYDLTSGKSRPVQSGHGIFGDDLMYVDSAGRFILVAAQKTIFTYPSVFRVDLATMTSTEIVKPQDHVWNWFADMSGVVRTGLAGEGDKWWVYYRHDENSKFKRSASRPILGNADQIDTMEVAAGSDQGYAVASGASGRFGLYRYDFATGQLGAGL